MRLAVVGFLCCACLLQAQLLQPGEELEYEVSYLGITLGKITIVTKGVEYLGEKPTVRVASIMQSNPGIPFLSLWAVFESWLDTSATFSYRFEGRMRQGDGPEEYARYDIDYERRLVLAQEWEGGRQTVSRTIPIRTRMNEGLSLLFVARRFLGSGKSYRFPTVVNSDTAPTVIHFTRRREAVRVPALPYPVRAVYFRGTAQWRGVYGLTGAFEGWFSDDEARVPLRAKMRVYVGNVLIELVRWRRPGWEPPVYTGETQ
jgi:hypothetical protein